MWTTSPRLMDHTSFSSDGPHWKQVAFAETCVGRAQVERNGLKYELRAVVQIVPLPQVPASAETIDPLPTLDGDFASEAAVMATKRLFQPEIATLIGF
jgi:hypothetical protein